MGARAEGINGAADFLLSIVGPAIVEDEGGGKAKGCADWLVIEDLSIVDLGGVGVKLNEVVGPRVALEGWPVKLKTGDFAAGVVCAPERMLLVDVAGVAG